MILKSLSMTNYRVFSGKHTIDLTPREIDGEVRPIILFGGLNGSGKTTILSAIRLGFYGSNSLGRNVSKRAYHEHLTDCIHLSAVATKQSHNSEIEIEYEHGERGLISNYKIVRRWHLDNGEVEESLQIHRDGEYLKEMAYEHCQSFLNELVPIGVSDLFFFDGEKIANLAEEEGGAILREAINRLMGIDIIHRLRGDLGTYLKDQKLRKSSTGQKAEIDKLQTQFDGKIGNYEFLKDEKAHLDDRLQQVVAEINATERLLDERGGAWATSRNSEKLEIELLLKERDGLSDDIRQILSGLAPLFMAKNSLRSLLKTLETERDTKRQAILRDALQSNLATLKSNLLEEMALTDDTLIGAAVDRSYEAMFGEQNTPILHDLSETDFEKFRHTIEQVVPEQEAALKQKVARLEAVEENIALTSKNADRSPDEALLRAELVRLREQTKQRAELEHKIKSKLDEVKKALRDAMDVLRSQRRLDEELSKSDQRSLAAEYASKSRHLLSEFAEQTSDSKIKILEVEFVRAFRKLARKDDLHFSVSIDPQEFSVTLKDQGNNVVNKQQLSAGEKQIYAIAMLEALGRTTGRNLPIIIDTPLGRLDSKHRNKLVENYFRTASHQVIVLSTDTEVDEQFFNSLLPDISHAFELNFDSSTRSSSLKEGYFWEQSLKEAV